MADQDRSCGLGGRFGGGKDRILHPTTTRVGHPSCTATPLKIFISDCLFWPWTLTRWHSPLVLQASSHHGAEVTGQHYSVTCSWGNLSEDCPRTISEANQTRKIGLKLPLRALHGLGCPRAAHGRSIGHLEGLECPTGASHQPNRTISTSSADGLLNPPHRKPADEAQCPIR